jgi:hypothetical protein
VTAAIVTPPLAPRLGRQGGPTPPAKLALTTSVLSTIRDDLGWQRHGNRNAQTAGPEPLLYAQVVKCEHLFVTAQGSAYGRLRRALDTGKPTIALAAAVELDYVSLPDALELVLRLVDDPKKFRRAALRWHARYCGDLLDVGLRRHTPYSPALLA